MHIRDISCKDFRVETDHNSFYVTGLYDGGVVRYNENSARAVSLRIKFHIYHTGLHSGVKPTASIEAMLLPAPGEWHEIDKLNGNLLSPIGDMKEYRNEFIRAEAMAIVQQNFQNFKEHHNRPEIQFDEEHANREVDGHLFPRMRDDKFKELLTPDIDRLLQIACCVL